MSKNPYDDPEFKKWLEANAKSSGEGMKNSAMMLSLVTKDALKDPLCALQLGFAVLMDKPIMLIVDKNMKVPGTLVRAARHIEKADLNDNKDMQRAMVSIREFMEAHVKDNP